MFWALEQVITLTEGAANTMVAETLLKEHIAGRSATYGEPIKSTVDHLLAPRLYALFTWFPSNPCRPI